MKVCIVSKADGRISAIVPAASMKPKGKDAPAAVEIVPMDGQSVRILSLPAELAKVPLPVLANSYSVKEDTLVPLPGSIRPEQKRDRPRKK